MASPPAEPLSQRAFAVELRYRIDVAIGAEERRETGINPTFEGAVAVAPVSSAIERVTKLAEDHPRAMKSKHVRHNLGADRLVWLREKGIA